MFSDIISLELKKFKKIKRDLNRVSVSYEEINEKSLLKNLNSKLELERLALKSKEITDSFFGKTVLLYAPLYISNYCVNGCSYCGFSATNRIERDKLEDKEIEKEMIALKEKGFDTILILTGEDRIRSGVGYILKAIKIARKYFSEILIETYPLEQDEYKKLIDNGLCGVTLYQETYDKNLYLKLHKFGPKKNFEYRLNAIERAVKAGIKEVNIGPLLGLNKNFDFDVYMTLMHAKHIQNNYPEVEVSISYPRMRSSVSKIKTYPVTDIDFVKIICLSRLFLERVGINISTRENAYIRDNLIGIGITKMSAESKTTVGGYFQNSSDLKQFEIEDSRSLNEIIKIIEKKGYRPEFTNWVKI